MPTRSQFTPEENTSLAGTPETPSRRERRVAREEEQRNAARRAIREAKDRAL
jgi:hypothetical protein